MTATPIDPAALDAVLSRAAVLNVRATTSLRALLFIADQDGPQISRIAEHVGITPAAITGMIDRLAEQGLIDRKSTPGDRRGQSIFITEKGADALLEILGTPK